MSMYEIAEKSERDIEYGFIQYSEIRNQSAPIGDSLSRLWGHFGPPQNILYEGFIYNITDKATGLTFIFSFGGSGPVYLGEQQYLNQLNPIVKAFEKFIDDSPNADCEIEVDTDFGIYVCGAKNGVPYDRELQKNDKQDPLSIDLTKKQYYDEAIGNIKANLESSIDKQKCSKQVDIDECILYLDTYVVAILQSKTADEGLYALQIITTALNNLNKRCGNNLFDPNVKKQIIELLNSATQEMHYTSLDEDATEKWRDW